MGSDAESDPYSLPLFSLIAPHDVTEPSGMLTPPRQTLASVPFQWEEQPGKPRPCTDLIIAPGSPHTRCLDLPPRLAMAEYYSNKITKTTSPTTVLEGKSVFSSASFRFNKERRRRGPMQGSFDSNCSGGWSPIDDSSGLQQPIPDNKNRRFASFRVHKPKDSFVISPSSRDTGFADGKKMRRNFGVSKVTRSHFWATIYEGFKQVVPWRKKTKKESFTF